jgi:hypothetical protein
LVVIEEKVARVDSAGAGEAEAPTAKTVEKAETVRYLFTGSPVNY